MSCLIYYTLIQSIAGLEIVEAFIYAFDLLLIYWILALRWFAKSEMLLAELHMTSQKGVALFQCTVGMQKYIFFVKNTWKGSYEVEYFYRTLLIHKGP